jgi:hypothetical protein
MTDQHHHHVKVGQLGGVTGGLHDGLNVEEDGGDEQAGGDGVARVQILHRVQRVPACSVGIALRPWSVTCAVFDAQ